MASSDLSNPAASDTDAYPSQIANFLDDLAFFTLQDEDHPVSSPDTEQSVYNGLQDFHELLPTTDVQDIIANSFFSDFGQNQPPIAREQQPQLYHHRTPPLPPPPPPALPPRTYSFPPPIPYSFPPLTSLPCTFPPPTPYPFPTPLFTNIPFIFPVTNSQGQFQHPQQRRNQPRGLQRLSPQSLETSARLPHRQTTQSSASGPRKRKSNSKKKVVEVTAENLCNDEWSWRKYGQKPIKGTLYPRNYYRCSSSKGCGARKQVERSSKNTNMFTVSYSGDHTHPRPAYRSSLSGTFRNKFPTVQKPSDEEPTAEKTPDSSPLSLSSTSLSSITPMSAPMEHDKTNANIETTQAANMDGADLEGHGTESKGDGYYYEDEDGILIPNMIINEDIYKDMQGLGTIDESVFGFVVGGRGY